MKFSIRGVCVAMLIIAVAVRGNQLRLSWPQVAIVVANVLAVLYALWGIYLDFFRNNGNEKPRHTAFIGYVQILFPELLLVAASFYSLSNVLGFVTSDTWYTFRLLALSTVALTPNSGICVSRMRWMQWNVPAFLVLLVVLTLLFIQDDDVWICWLVYIATQGIESGLIDPAGLLRDFKPPLSRVDSAIYSVLGVCGFAAWFSVGKNLFSVSEMNLRRAAIFSLAVIVCIISTICLWLIFTNKFKYFSLSAFRIELLSDPSLLFLIAVSVALCARSIATRQIGNNRGAHNRLLGIACCLPIALAIGDTAKSAVWYSDSLVEFIYEMTSGLWLHVSYIDDDIPLSTLCLAMFVLGIRNLCSKGTQTRSETPAAVTPITYLLGLILVVFVPLHWFALCFFLEGVYFLFL